MSDSTSSLTAQRQNQLPIVLSQNYTWTASHNPVTIRQKLQPYQEELKLLVHCITIQICVSRLDANIVFLKCHPSGHDQE